MIWLKGQTLTPKQVFWPESMSLTLEERRSSASLTLGPDGPALSIGDWLKDDIDPGAGIIWRVKSIDMQYDTNTRTVSLEHIVNTLKDWVLFGEHTYEAMGGGSGGASAKQAIQYILARSGGMWELGAYEHPAQSEPYKFESDTLFSALEMVSSTLEDPFWEYDLTRIPFRLNVRKLTNKAAENEMRMTRNIQTLKRTVDRSRMYTRIYPIGYNDLHISGNYISRNEGLYGVVCSVQTNQGLTSEAELRMWADARLKRHCEPSVTVTVKGLALSADTGEPLDKLTLGRRCRIPLPEFNTTIVETINRLKYQDKIKDPKQVTVTMANLQEDIANLFESTTSSSASSTRGGGRAGKKKAEEDHAWFVDTTDHVGMVAEALIGKDGDEVDWSRVSRIIVDGTGIHQTVQQVSGDVVKCQTSIEQNESSITQMVQAVGQDGKITAASICLAIRNGSSEAYISADRIRLDGNTSIRQLLTGQATIGQLKVSDLRVQAQGGMGFISVANCINTAIVTNNELKLYRMNGELVATFSKATTQDGAWSGNITAGKSYKVEAKQNGRVVHTHYSPALDGYYTGTKSWASDYKSVDVPVTVYDADGTDLFRDTLNIDTSAAWQRGHDAAYPNSRSLTYNRTEELPSGTLRYHYYTTGNPIHTSGSLTVHW